MIPEKYSGIYKINPNQAEENPEPTVSDETLAQLAEIAQKTLSHNPEVSNSERTQNDQ